MRTRRFQLAAAAAASLLLATAWLLPRQSAAPAQAVLRGTVTTVYDGDTIKVKLGGRPDENVRLIGVDSQELDDSREPVRLLAFLAKRFAFGRLYRRTVELLPGPEPRDAYGRMLAFVRMDGGEIFNVTLVREGFAHAFLKFPFDEDLRNELKRAEEEARRSGRGLWRKEPYPVIAAAGAAGSVGGIFTVKFRCLRSFKRGGFHLLEADGAAFDAAIPLSVFRTLPGSLEFEGRTVEATGIIELYKGRPQIVIGVPVQLRSAER